MTEQQSGLSFLLPFFFYCRSVSFRSPVFWPGSSLKRWTLRKFWRHTESHYSCGRVLLWESQISVWTDAGIFLCCSLIYSTGFQAAVMRPVKLGNVHFSRPAAGHHSRHVPFKRLVSMGTLSLHCIPWQTPPRCTTQARLAPWLYPQHDLMEAQEALPQAPLSKKILEQIIPVLLNALSHAIWFRTCFSLLFHCTLGLTRDLSCIFSFSSQLTSKL